MFFTKLGRVIAWIATVSAALSIFIGYEIQWNQADSFVASLLSIDSPECPPSAPLAQFSVIA